MRDYFFVHDSNITDRCANLFIGAALKIRGSKKLFATSDGAMRYLDKIKGRNESVNLKGRYKARVREFYCGEMQCFSFSTGADCKKTVIYLPGGAFVRQPSSLHFKFADKLCRTAGIEVTVCIYPKAPEHTCNETLLAISELYRRLLRTHSSEDIIIGGDSAGGTVAVLIPAYLEKNHLPMFSKMFLFSPMLTVSLDMNDVREVERNDPMLSVDGLNCFAERWCGVRNDQNNPLLVSLDNMPSVYCFCGEKDILTFYSKVFFDRMKKAKNTSEMHLFKEMYHVFPLYPLKASCEVFDYICRLINEQHS